MRMIEFLKSENYTLKKYLSMLENTKQKRIKSAFTIEQLYTH